MTSLIKKTRKDVASHRYRELKNKYKTRFGKGYEEDLIFEFVKEAPWHDDDREELRRIYLVPFPAVNKKMEKGMDVPIHKVAVKLQ